MSFEILIQVLDENGVLLAQRTSSTFESAEEDLGKLERYIGEQDEKLKEITNEQEKS